MNILFSGCKLLRVVGSSLFAVSTDFIDFWEHTSNDKKTLLCAKHAITFILVKKSAIFWCRKERKSVGETCGLPEPHNPRGPDLPLPQQVQRTSPGPKAPNALATHQLTTQQNRKTSNRDQLIRRDFSRKYPVKVFAY